MNATAMCFECKTDSGEPVPYNPIYGPIGWFLVARSIVPRAVAGSASATFKYLCPSCAPLWLDMEKWEAPSDGSPVRWYDPAPLPAWAVEAQQEEEAR